MPFAGFLFYSFTSVHSFLSGLLPFYIPIILLRAGFSILDICIFIAITALNFVLALKFWRIFFEKEAWRWMLSISFICELILVYALVNINSTIWLFVAAVSYGVYNCFYWTTQRFMFSVINSKNNQKNTGNLYANFQILVFVFLKLGILLGAWLISNGDESSVLFLSFFIFFCACLVIFYNKNLDRLTDMKNSIKRSRVNETKFKDKENSKFIFGIDGIFLYLESFFWVMTLYFFLQENVLRLGIIIIALSLILVILFFLIREYIDRINTQRVYIVGVIFYALSWFLRAGFTEAHMNIDNTSYILILLIAFLTMFFRLCFNKRFFDHADQKITLNYLLAKSYISQYYLLIVFSILVITHKLLEYNDLNVSFVYVSSGVLALLYCVYKKPIQNIN